jgi:hypothetical protein
MQLPPGGPEHYDPLAAAMGARLGSPAGSGLMGASAAEDDMAAWRSDMAEWATQQAEAYPGAYTRSTGPPGTQGEQPVWCIDGAPATTGTVPPSTVVPAVAPTAGYVSERLLWIPQRHLTVSQHVQQQASAAALVC